jgi:2,3-bisphosphoglycerate-independent phosphoglycerate mutase
LGAFANLATATAVDRNVVAKLTESKSRLAKQLEDNATSLKEVKALLKKSAQNVLVVVIRNAPLAAPSHHPRITIAGHTVTKWHVPIQAKLVCTQRKGTNVKQQKPKIWEGPKSTGIDL